MIAVRLITPRYAYPPDAAQMPQVDRPLPPGSHILVQESHQPDEGRPAPEDRPGEPGSGGSSQSPAADKPPAVPADDDSAVGDTDQHSDATDQ
jgi:hypothetical protein